MVWLIRYTVEEIDIPEGYTNEVVTEGTKLSYYQPYSFSY